MDRLSLLRRADALQNSTANGTQPAMENAQTHIMELMLQKSVKYRTSIMLLVAFNMASAVVLIGLVLFDSSRLAKKAALLGTGERRRFYCRIRPAEVATLSIASVILAQGTVFLAVQSMGLGELDSHSCREIGQIVFPFLWIVDFVLLVFGVKTTLRSCQKSMYLSRGRWNISVCWLVVIAMLLLLWIPTRIRQPVKETCRADLFVFTLPWADVAFGVTLWLICSYAILGLVLTIQLLRTPRMDRTQKIAASQMVYYLGLGIIVSAIFLPLWAQSTFKHGNDWITLMMATVALNTTGIIMSFLHLILRSHGDSMIIRAPDSWQGHRRWKLFSSRSMNVGYQIAEPVVMYSDAGQSQKALHGTPQRSDTVNKANPHKSLPPPPILKIPGYGGHGRKKSQYSIFPTKESTRQLLHARPSIYEDEDLLIPPRPLFSFQHQRNSSDVTHATVQIGLRLSNIDPPPPEVDLLDRRSDLHPHSFLKVPRERSGLREVTNHFSAASLDVPVTFRDSGSQRSTEADYHLQGPSSSLRGPPHSPTAADAPKRPVDLLATMKSLPRHPPVVYRGPQTDQQEKDVENGSDDIPTLSSSSSSSSSPPNNDQWPLREPIHVILPKRTYQPEKETWI